MRKLLLILILFLNSAAFIISVYLCGIWFFSKNKPVNKSQQLTIVREKIDIDDNKNEPALVNISSIPQEAKVFVNGYYKGKTPVEFKIVDLSGIGNYRLVLIKQGYLRWEKQIELNSEKLKNYNITLEKKKE